METKRNLIITIMAKWASFVPVANLLVVSYREGRAETNPYAYTFIQILFLFGVIFYSHITVSLIKNYKKQKRLRNVCRRFSEEIEMYNDIESQKKNL